MIPSPLTPEMIDLIERVATYPHGLGFLRQADLESIAVTLRVHPFVVVEARRILETPEGRSLLVRELRRTRSRLRGVAAIATTIRNAEPGPVAPDGPEKLIQAARAHPLGLRFLLLAPFETVAVTFRVHPSVVFRARTLLHERRAHPTEPGRLVPGPDSAKS